MFVMRVSGHVARPVELHQNLLVVPVHAEGVQYPVVDPQMCPFLLNYFKCRAEYVTDQGLITRALFPGGNSEGGYMQGNTIRNLKNIASEEVGGWTSTSASAGGPSGSA